MQFLLRSLACPAFQPAASQDRKLQALRHREGMGKTGARTAGGTGAVLLFSASLDASSARFSTRSTRL
jgi:hypothetical protein